jgi:nucleotidyltransferase/DNA polymerase involved in DNA repair
MDALFAEVEQKHRLELVGKSVLDGGSEDPSKRSVASTASYKV